jgi:hypothetical protein
MIDLELELHLDHFDAGQLGSVTCRVIKWNPPTSPLQDHINN